MSLSKIRRNMNGRIQLLQGCRDVSLPLQCYRESEVEPGTVRLALNSRTELGDRFIEMPLSFQLNSLFFVTGVKERRWFCGSLCRQ